MVKNSDIPACQKYVTIKEVRFARKKEKSSLECAGDKWVIC